MTTMTAETTDAVSGGATYRGRIWTVTPQALGPEDVSTAATTYTSRNASKSARVRTWMGLRYANMARWTPPVVDNSTGLIGAATWPNVPYQQSNLEQSGVGRPEWGNENGDYDWDRYPGGNVVEAENVCTINAWAPEGAGPFPVFVWFHGGAWTVNSANAYQTLGHRLAMKGVSVFSVEYPLSNFGFFYDPTGATNPDFALQCQKMALEWIKVRAAAFGGDPDNITIGGTSAGGAAVLAMMEDTSTHSLFQRAYASSGGGNGQRYREGPCERNIGYAALYARYKKAIEEAAPYIRDAANPTRTLAAAITADGYLPAIRAGLTPQNVMALSDGGRRVRGFGGTLAMFDAASRNVFPLQDGVTLTYESSMAAVKADAFADKPLWLTTAGNEASLIGYNNTLITAPVNPYAFARLLGYMGPTELFAESFMSSLDYDEQVRRTYNDSIFGLPAYYIAYHHANNGNAAYLTLSNRKSPGNGSIYSNHSTDRMDVFGNKEWSVGMTGSVARVFCDDILYADGYMQMIANYCKNGNPNTAYSFAGDFDLFASPAGFSLTAFNTTDEHWNIAGKNSATNATDAPATITPSTDFRTDAFDAYMARLA